MKSARTHNADADNRRGLLLESARDAFFEYGYQRASMREVARRKGMTQSAIYYHFSDKEDLLFNVIDDFTDRFAASLMSTVAGAQTPREKLAQLISTQFDLLFANQKDLKILSEEKNHLSKMRLRVIRGKEKTVLTIYRACLEELHKAGELADVDPTVAAFSMIGAINWLYQWYRPEGALSGPVVKDSMMKLLLHGVCKPVPVNVPASPRARKLAVHRGEKRNEQHSR